MSARWTTIVFAVGISKPDSTIVVASSTSALPSPAAEQWAFLESRIADSRQQTIDAVVGESPKLAKLVAMREELRQIWTRTNVSAEQAVADLQAWCRKAEDSGIAALQDFSRKLRAAHA